MMANPIPEQLAEARRGVGDIFEIRESAIERRDNVIPCLMDLLCDYAVGLIARRDELLAENTAEVERRRAAEAECARLSALVADIGRKRLALAEKLRAAEALAERMWPIVEAVARAFEEKKVRYEKINNDWIHRMPDHWPADMSLTMQAIRAAAALVRERDDG